MPVDNAPECEAPERVDSRSVKQFDLASCSFSLLGVGLTTDLALGRFKIPFNDYGIDVGSFEISYLTIGVVRAFGGPRISR